MHGTEGGRAIPLSTDYESVTYASRGRPVRRDSRTADTTRQDDGLHAEQPVVYLLRNRVRPTPLKSSSRGAEGTAR
jgi:hypothetical protein